MAKQLKSNNQSSAMDKSNCKHEVVFNQLCAICGASITKQISSNVTLGHKKVTGN
jgi:hypothetical protein